MAVVCSTLAGEACTVAHCCRSGKTWIAWRFLFGDSLEGAAPPMRPHQQAALQTLRCLKKSNAAPHKLMVFSSLAVLQQFIAEYLARPSERGVLDVEQLGRVLVLCSVASSAIPLWCETLQGRSDDEEEVRLQAILRDRDRACLFLTTYESSSRIYTALRAFENEEFLEEAKRPRIDRAALDEAHNAHTPTRFFLWGGDPRSNEETTSGEEDENSSDALTPSEAGLARLGRQFPSRLYMTATPRDAMKRLPSVYGDRGTEEQWSTYTFADLVRDQRDRDLYPVPCVKEFDITVVFNGAAERIQEGAELTDRSREFCDRVSFLRNVLIGGKGRQESVERALLFHAYANHTERAARTFADPAEWQRAFDYLKETAPSLIEGWNFIRDFKIYSVIGGDGNVAEALKDFNSDDPRVHILCSCQALKEGVTLRRCDLTGYADGKRSHRDIVQSALRGVVYDPQKPEARLKLLLLVSIAGSDVDREDDVKVASEKIKACLQSGRHMDSLAAVLAALQEQDPSLSDDLRQWAASLADQTPATPATPERHITSSFEDDSPRMEPAAQEPTATNAGQNVMSTSIDIATDDVSETQASVVTSREDALRHADEAISHVPCGRRVHCNLDLDAFQWQLASQSIDDLSRELAQEVSSLTIEAMDNRHRSREDMMSLKVSCFCKLWPGTEIPKQGDKRSVPVEWLSPGADLNEVDGGVFWSNIGGNFIGDGSANITLGEPDKAKVRALPWFKAALKRLEEARTKREEFYRGSMSEQVAWLAHFWPGDEIPRQKDERWVPAELLPEGETRRAKIDGGVFWQTIIWNFTDEEKPRNARTLKEPADKERVFGLPWVRVALERVQAKRARRHSAILQQEAKKQKRTAAASDEPAPFASKRQRRARTSTDNEAHIRKDHSAATTSVVQDAWAQQPSERAQQPAAKAKVKVPSLSSRNYAAISADIRELILPEGQVECDQGGQLTVTSRAALREAGYDVARFTMLHHEWKDANIQALISLCRVATDRALVLDHWSDVEQTRLRTVDALLEAGLAQHRCYCANPDEEICWAVEARGAEAVAATFAQSLQEGGAWRSVAFDVVYGDFCYGNEEKVRADLELLLSRHDLPKPRILVYTLTGRGKGTMVERLDTIHDFLTDHGYVPALDGRLRKSRRIFAACSVATCFYRLA